MSEIKPQQSSSLSKKQQVEEMFDHISGTYDKTNRFISLGLDARWKRRLIMLLMSQQPSLVLDLATGTADLPLLMAQKGLTNITGLDLSAGMLSAGQKRLDAAKRNDVINLVQGDSENLPFADNAFDAVTVSYGLRNYENLEKGLKETHRVLKPGGVFLILETSVPTAPIVKQVYVLFTKHLMPWIGRLFSGDKNSYQYLSQSAANFPCGPALQSILEECGFGQVAIKPQFFGAASIYSSQKES